MTKNLGWKFKKTGTNVIVGNEKKPTNFESGQVIINKKATSKNIDKLIDINKEGTTNKSSKVTSDATDGGILKGKSHAKGGIPGKVDGVKTIETEGDEFVVNKEASEKYWKELSKINQSSGNGVPINPPNNFDEDPEEFSKGGKIEFNPNHIPNKWILTYAKNIKANYPKIWSLGGNIFGNQAFKNLSRVAERGYWLDSEEWMYIKWRSYVARHQRDYRIEGVIAMLKWVDKVEKGWPYMKQLIEERIKKIESKKKGWKHKMKEGGLVDEFPNQIKGNDDITWVKTKQSKDLVNYTPYYRGYNIDIGGYNFRTLKEAKDFISNYILSNQLYNKLRYEPIKELPKMKEGGRTIAQTPAPKKERIKGSKVNKPESSASTKSASSIKFDEKTIASIKNKVAEHNKKHPDKKITLASAKAVVRRGMGAYSSSHRPTISGGQPNSRNAWGLARLNAFTYKIVKGKSKSGKYSQDDDLINELGYSVSKMKGGGNVNDYKTIAFFTNKKFKIFDDNLSFTDIKKLYGITPLRIERIEIKKDNLTDNSLFIKWSEKEMKDKFNEKMDVTNLYFSIVKDGDKNVVKSAYWENSLNNTKYKYDAENITWVKDNEANTYKDGGELQKGIKAEKEHQSTINKIYGRKVSIDKAAELIAKDHLKEDPKYYSKLEKMEGTKFAQGGLVVNGIEVNIGDIGLYNGRIKENITVNKITPKLVYYTNDRGKYKNADVGNFIKYFILKSKGTIEQSIKDKSIYNELIGKKIIVKAYSESIAQITEIDVDNNLIKYQETTTQPIYTAQFNDPIALQKLLNGEEAIANDGISYKLLSYYKKEVSSEPQKPIEKQQQISSPVQVKEKFDANADYLSLFEQNLSNRSELMKKVTTEQIIDDQMFVFNNIIKSIGLNS